MSHFRKPGVLLSLLAVTGAMLTSSQARGQFLLEGARRKPAYAGSLDGGPEMTEMRERLYRRWRDDVEEAKRRHKKVKLVADPAKRKIQAPVTGGDPYVYFPTGTTNDGKFLVLAGAQGTSTLSGAITIKMATASGATALDLAVFDGDHGGLWDQGTAVTTYTLYEDGNANGQADSGENQIASWNGSAMSDNAWSSLTAAGTVGGTPIDPSAYAGAVSPSGIHFFRLVIQLSSASTGSLNCFKVRTSGSIRLMPQDSFNLTGALATNTVNIIYPNYPSLSPTTFDGAWDLYTFVPSSIDYRNPLRPHSFDVWDGDLDYGSQLSVAEQDTDDPNTPNSVASLPVWAQAGNPSSEGVAVGYGGTTGNPPDDMSRAVFARSPSITYDVTDPSGVRYTNSNPSGNSEWELFRIETDPSVKNDTSVADAAAPGAFLPGGIFQTHISGMDLSNLNSFRFEYDVLGVDSRGNPVKPLLPYVVGDTVYRDTNFNGLQDVGELGIANVAVSLLDDNGNVLDTATTNASGQYFFGVEAGDYSVRVELSNFRGSGALVGLLSTTGGEILSNTVTTANILTYDFGYASAPSGSVGDYVWLDADGDGVQDTTEPGIGGVSVSLSEGGTVVATTTTDLNGFYLFSGLDAASDHTYTVTVSGSVLSGLTQTYDADGLSTALNSTLTLTAGNSDVLQDFGFRGSGSIGDLVWNDQSSPINTTFDQGVDIGLANVRVVLTWDYNGDGSVDMQYVTTTDANGYYLFSGLAAATAPGSYRVRVDTNTLPFGLQLISDPDGTDTPSYATLTLAAAASNLAQDFGYRGAGSIGDTVWFDANANGVQDGAEAGIANVAVTLTGDYNYDGVADYTATTVTNSSGQYFFSNLPGARYTVTVAPGSARSNWTPTYDLDGTGTPHTAVGTLQPRTSNLNFDFGYNNAGSSPASVGDFVWSDANANGVQDSGELGLSGVTVRLLDSTGVTTISTQVTTSNGSYLFTNLTPGTYRVQFTNLPSGYVLSPVLQGGNTATDSDADPANSGQTAQFTLTSGQNLTTIDAGVYQAASVGDFVWNDVNRNGLQDSGETGVTGATVTLFTSANIQVGSPVITTSSGAYSFTGLTPGTYYVQFTLPSGYGITGQSVGLDTTIDSDANAGTGKTANFTLTPGQARTDIDAGGYQSASIGDFIWVDTNSNGIQDGGETGLAGVVVNLFASNDALLATSAATTSSGAYSFTGLAPGTYYVQFVLPNNYAFAPKDVATGGGTDSNDSDADTTTGKTGNYTLTSGQAQNTVDAGAIVSSTARVGDFVWEDRNGNGIQDAGDSGLANVTVQLYNNSNVLQSTKTTDTAGAYAFTGLAAGNYYVKFTLPSGYVFSPKDVSTGGATDLTDSDADTTSGQTATFALASGQNNSTLDAGMFQPASVGDTVWLDSNANGVQDYTDSNGNGRWDTAEPGETGVSGVTVQLYTTADVLSGTTTTDGQGHYLFSNVVSGDYYVTFTLPSGYAFTSKNTGADTSRDSDADTTTGKTSTITLSSGRAPIIWDAGIYQLAGVGDFIWSDTNQNGRQDLGEPGLTGAQVKLFNASTGLQVGSTATTTSSGAYSFTSLNPGSYYVQVTLPSGYLFSPKTASIATTTTDSNVNPTTGVTSTTDPFTLTSGQTDNTIDAGASPTPAGSLGDKVWIDTNRNGIQDAGETTTDATRSVTVTLYNSSTNVQVGAAKTVTLGATYTFTGLDAGSYYVKFTGLPSGYSLSAKNASTGAAATDSDPDPSTGTTSTVVLGRGENRTDVDAGVSTTVATASVGDFVWYDLNGNGIQDSGEPGLTGATVKLYTSANVQVGSTVTTTSSGAYSFTGLSAGTYYMKFALPSSPSYVFTQQTQGSNTAVDSDVNAAGQTANFALGNGQALTTIDCGAALLGSIGEVVWYDYNRDGIRQTTEQGLAGVTVTLSLGATVVGTRTTDANGFYLFSSLVPGQYSVSVAVSTIPTSVLPANSIYRTYDYDGYAASPDVAIYPLSAGEDVRFLNFGYSTAPKINTGVPFMTFTIGGWGAAPTGGNPGSRLHAAFISIYGDFASNSNAGVEYGVAGSGSNKYTATFRTAQAVTDYLPNGGGSGILTGDLVNPITTPAGTLGSQLLAVRLGRDFSVAGITGFKNGLGSLKYINAASPFNGKTVDQILSYADNYVGGTNSPFTGLSPTPTAAQLTTALTDINENYDNGTVDRGHLGP